MIRRIAITHRTSYAYDRPVLLSPHRIRLRPTPLARARIEAYALAITPVPEAVHWQEDPWGNRIARAVFGEATEALDIDVRLVAGLADFNPFDFLVADRAMAFPFSYEADERSALAGYLHCEATGERFAPWLAAARQDGAGTVEFVVALNRAVARDIGYVRRYEPGVQDCETTLALRKGSCRDSAWLLVQALRHCSIAARFVSGYLVQFTDTGASSDSVDLHAWSEAYLPGAGWIGFDPTSGLLAGPGHIPLARAGEPPSAAAVDGYAEPAESRLGIEMHLTRLPATEAAAVPRYPFRYRNAAGTWQDSAGVEELGEIQARYDEFELTGQAVAAPPGPP